MPECSPLQRRMPRGALGWGLSGTALLFAWRLAMPTRFRA
jgi:hypothetical protein